MWPVQYAHFAPLLEGLPELCLFFMPRGGQGEPCLTDAAPRGRCHGNGFLLVKGGNAGLCASRNFNGLATGWTAADEPKSPFTC